MCGSSPANLSLASQEEKLVIPLTPRYNHSIKVRFPIKLVNRS